MSVPFSHVQLNANSLVHGSSNFNSLSRNNQQLNSIQGYQQLNSGTSFSLPHSGLSNLSHVVSSIPNVANVCNPVNVPNLTFMKSTPPPNIAPASAMLPFHNMGNQPSIGSQNAHGQQTNVHNVVPGNVFNPLNHLNSRIWSMQANCTGPSIDTNLGNTLSTNYQNQGLNLDPKIWSMQANCTDSSRNTNIGNTSQSINYQNQGLISDLHGNHQNFNTDNNGLNYGVFQQPNNLYERNAVATNPSIINNALFSSSMSSNGVNMLPFQNGQLPSNMLSLNGQFSSTSSPKNFVPSTSYTNHQSLSNHLNNNFKNIPMINFPNSLGDNIQLRNLQNSNNGNNRFGYNKFSNSNKSNYRNESSPFSPSPGNNSGSFNHNFRSSSPVPNHQGSNSKLGIFSPSNVRPFFPSPQNPNFRNFNNRVEIKPSPSPHFRQERTDFSRRPYGQNVHQNSRFPQGQSNENQNYFQGEKRGQNFHLCCDTCDRSFKNDNELQYHMSQHKKCDYKDCPFEAHPKVVALHKKMQHETGYADAINKLKNAGEIEKWRAERRKRFPTVENIRKRKAEDAEKIARGEVVETKDFGNFKKPKMDKRKRPRQSRFKTWQTFGPHAIKKNTVVDIESDSDSDNEEQPRFLLPPFRGLNEDNQMLNSDSEELCEVNKSVIVLGDTSESDVHIEQEIVTLNESDCGESGNSVVEIDPNEGVDQINQHVQDEDIFDQNSTNTPAQSPDETDKIENLFITDNIPKENSFDDFQSPDKTNRIETATNNAALIQSPNVAVKVKTANQGSKNPYNNKALIQSSDVTSKTATQDSENVSNNEALIQSPNVTNNIETATQDSETHNEALNHSPEIKTATQDSKNPSNNEAIQNPVKVTAGLSLLMNQSDSDDDSPPDEVPISRQEVVQDTVQSKEPAVGEESVESKSPEEGGRRQRQRFNRNTPSQENGEGAKRSRKFQRQDDYVPEVRKSLLEKLLADDIRHERNVIMQCVRHIVNKKFFEVKSKK